MAAAQEEQDGSPEPTLLTDALVQTAFATMAILSRVGAEHDLSLTQLRALAILRDRRLRMAELASYLGLEKSTMSGLVERAERRGLLERGPNTDDGRAVDVFLSPEGRQLAHRLGVRVDELLAPRLEGLNNAEQDRLRRLLSRVADSTAR
jgi:DNA-binding MarR family transcriptional regulator